MMKTLAYKIASLIKRTDPEGTHSIEVMQYSLGIILNTVFIFVTSILLGWVTGRMGETVLVFLGIGILRMCSGGTHLKSAWACNIVSIVICVAIPHLSLFFGSMLIYMNVASLVIMLWFAPRPDANVHISRKAYPWLKIVSVLLVALNFIIGSSVVGLAFLVQSLTIIPLRRRKSP
ncbi:accessory gene regulator B [Paenibacillus sp. DS2015]|uniref:accessory gene regulator ArgB-like protein n=1 Tax=Paenibacillus sp. DS2015 TaxID=3373917 RepID=UPI003D1BA865